MEERVARLESDVAHMRSDIREIKDDMRAMHREIKDDMREMRRDITALALSTERGFSHITRWGIGLYIALVAGLATGFMWVVQRLPAVH